MNPDTEFPEPDDPEEALAAVLALRRLADAMERRAVRAAVDRGWSWARIARALGVSKQAAHKRLSDIVARNGADNGADAGDERSAVPAGRRPRRYSLRGAGLRMRPVAAPAER